MIYKMHVIYVISWLFVFSVNCTLIHKKFCKTPTNDDGKCVIVDHCEPLKLMLLDEHKTEENITYWKHSQCGCHIGRPKVCCPLSCNETKYSYETHNARDSNKHFTYQLLPPSTNEQCSDAMTALPPEPGSVCCGRNSDYRTDGGMPTNVDDYPWLVLIEYYNKTLMGMLCGGMLISGKYVLTAAHCVSGEKLQGWIPTNVRLGEYNVSNDGIDNSNGKYADKVVTIPINKYILHPKYNFSKSKRHDIALIRLNETAPYTNFIRPICLPTIDYTKSNKSRLQFYIAGWGQYKAGDKTYKTSDIKLYSPVPFVARNKCEKSLKCNLSKGQICAGGQDKKDSCFGDSGGPLMYELNNRTMAIGIVSFGAEKCGERNIPSVYTNVHHYLSWIIKTILKYN